MIIFLEILNIDNFKVGHPFMTSTFMKFLNPLHLHHPNQEKSIVLKQ